MLDVTTSPVPPAVRAADLAGTVLAVLATVVLVVSAIGLAAGPTSGPLTLRTLGLLVAAGGVLAVLLTRRARPR